MNRLALNPALRAARVTPRQCPPQLAQVCRASPPRRFASTQVHSPPSAKFETLFTSLNEKMGSEELAKRVAAIYSITDKKNELEQVQKRLKFLLQGKDLTPVKRRIAHYMKHKPTDLIETGYEARAPSWLKPEAEQALLDVGLSKFDYLSTLMETDPSVKLLNSLDAPTSEAVELDWMEFKSKQNTQALERILQFYSKHGLDFAPPSNETAPFVKKLRQQSAEDAAPLLASGQDAVLVAQDAARTADLNNFRPPPTSSQYPDLMQFDPILDPQNVIEFPPTAECPFHNKVIVRNHRSVFHNYSEDPNHLPDIVESVDEFTQALPVSKSYFDGLHQSVLIRRNVVQQTGKGKIRRVSYMVLLGNADGLVGLGEGKHANSMVALKSARIAAVRNMDWVERFEKRTVWTEMRAKLGGTELILRPRPVGFGLRCNPYLHQILRAAGFKDISAKVWGSRNRLNVIKAAFRMLQAGHAPTGMGDGLGGPGKKLSKGTGLISKSELERARGRKLIALRK